MSGQEKRESSGGGKKPENQGDAPNPAVQDAATAPAAAAQKRKGEGKRAKTASVVASVAASFALGSGRAPSSTPSSSSSPPSRNGEVATGQAAPAGGTGQVSLADFSNLTRADLNVLRSEGFDLENERNQALVDRARNMSEERVRKGKAAMTSAAQALPAASGPENAVPSVEVHKKVQEVFREFPVGKDGIVALSETFGFNLGAEGTAESDSFMKAVEAIVSLEVEGAIAHFSPSGGGRSAAASAPSSSSSPVLGPEGLLIADREKVAAAEQRARKKYNESPFASNVEGLPKELQARIHARVQVTAEVFVITHRHSLSSLLVSREKEDVLPGRPYLKKATTLEQEKAILRKRAAKRKTTDEEKKEHLDKQLIKIFFKNKVSGCWDFIETYLVTDELTSTPKQVNNSFVTHLQLGVSICKKIGLEVGCVFIIERFPKIWGVPGSVPVYALTVMDEKIELSRESAYKWAPQGKKREK